MKLQIRVDESGKITDAKFKTFGCGSAIASSSYMTELVKGLSLEEAAKIKNTVIAKELCLPPVKLHCSSKDFVTVCCEETVCSHKCSVGRRCHSVGNKRLSIKATQGLFSYRIIRGGVCFNVYPVPCHGLKTSLLRIFKISRKS
jgi:hypothetical protein